MHHLFIDESGELGSHVNSSDHFIIVILETEHPKALDKRIKKFSARLRNYGWPKQLEIKGTSLWGAAHYSQIPKVIADRNTEFLSEIIEAIVSGPNNIHYSIVKKNRLSDHLKSAPYGIAYNYFAGKLLCRAHNAHFNGPIDLIVDQRSKETHHKDKFDGYIETQLITEALHSHEIKISHKESHVVRGLQAVDFISWGLFRHYEHNDQQFKSLIDPGVKYRDNWYARSS